MKVLLTALNSKHTHRSLALGYIKAYWERVADRPALEVKEYDLNQSNEFVISDIILQKPDVVAFSTYIWSITRVVEITGAIKAALPDSTIVLGGPEAGNDAQQLLDNFPWIDFIVRGEGEVTFELFLLSFKSGAYEHINGLSYQQDKIMTHNPPAPFIANLDDLASPFKHGIYGDGKGFSYYEASRGCPSKCSYCLSSILGPVRNHSIERVKSDLEWFFASGFTQIRFTDRTFNYDPARAMEIIEFILAHNKKNICFHFEIQADFLTDEMMKLLAKAPAGMFRLEIGIQSTKPETLLAVNRMTDLPQMTLRIKQLLALTNCQLHVDLLGGLPNDSFANFKNTVDETFALEPHEIQAAMVKVLRGTPLQRTVEKGSIRAMPTPPYTIVSTDWLEVNETISIADMARLIEILYNSERYKQSIKCVANCYYNNSVADFFEHLARYFRYTNQDFYGHSPESIYYILYDFIESQPDSGKLICQSLIEHELHLAQKIPNETRHSVLPFKPLTGKTRIKLAQGTKSFWFQHDIESLLQGEFSEKGWYPEVYCFQADLSKSRKVQLLDLAHVYKFIIACLQLRYSAENLPELWNLLYDEKSMPGFETAIDKLVDYGLLYDSATRSKQKLDINFDMLNNLKGEL